MPAHYFVAAFLVVLYSFSPHHLIFSQFVFSFSQLLHISFAIAFFQKRLSVLLWPRFLLFPLVQFVFTPIQEAPGADAGSDTPLAYRTLDDEKRPTILICNGDAGNMSYYQLFLAVQFTSRGYNVATFDWRGFGASDPFPMDPDYLCYTEMLEDYRAVIRQVSAKPEVLPGGIYLLGWSTGAYLSMIAAEGNPSVKGCILRGVPTSFEQVIPILQKAVGKDSTQLLVPEDFPVGKMPLALADTFGKDILIVVGQNDERTPVWMAEDIFAALPDGIKKELWVAPGAKHGGMEAPEVLYPEEFVRRVSRFVECSLGGEQ